MEGKRGKEREGKRETEIKRKERRLKKNGGEGRRMKERKAD